MSTSQNKNHKHKFFMSLALQQAMLNLGNTNENPSVGCTITKKNSVISVGNTGFNGRPHAEQNAIDNSREKVAKADLYVTLEPCSNYGKTPPCVKKIIKNKIKNVYFSIPDPDIRSKNKSSKKFKEFNIKVKKGIFSKEIKEFYKSYILHKENKLPFVTCKLAVSKDFFTINKNRKWITNKYSRGRVHLMRSKHDVIITSSETIIKDNPFLDCRINGLEKTSPARIILDNYLKTPLNCNVIKSKSKGRTFIFYNKKNIKKIQLLKKLGIKTYKIHANETGNLDLKEVLFKTKKLGFSRVFLESGIRLSTNFLNENLVNELKIFISNQKLSKNGRGNIGKFLKNVLRGKKSVVEKVYLFDEKLISYKIK